MGMIVIVGTLVGAGLALISKCLVKGNRRRPAAWTVASAAIVALGLAIGPPTASADVQPPVAKLKLGVSATRFVVRGDDVIARGPVLARAVRADGTTDTLRERARFKVKPTHRCRIIKLHLAPLFLNLLGLEARTSTIDLKATGDRRRTLGRLFCRLSSGITLGKHRLAKRTARSLNRSLHGRPLRFLSFTAPLRAGEPIGGSQTAEGAVPPPSPDSCEILHLLLGPLHLDLIGLIVDLHGERKTDPVKVLVTADPNGGELGSLLCPSSGA